uniref:Uncharacterized protein n=1 Tax=Mycena chlorophos TaxID=658473 RepID=A0ABQ0MD16_MYCCL|nr:predicted protein [Mycena chlorophos]
MLNAAHEAGAAAEEYMAQGLFIPAADEHRKASSFLTHLPGSNPTIPRLQKPIAMRWNEATMNLPNEPWPCSRKNT